MNAQSRRNRVRMLSIIVCASALVIASAPVNEAKAKRETARDSEQSRPGATPLVAVVALREQRISIYDQSGKMLEAPISSGATGYETPAGIYSVVQKEEEHHSNLYDDASMPFMERITWTGIALHAGELPGRPASHGCVRMPLAFAGRLYQLTKLGMRVIVVREDITPVETIQPAIFNWRAPLVARLRGAPREARSLAEGMTMISGSSQGPSDEVTAPLPVTLQALQSRAVLKRSEAAAAIKREKDLRAVAQRKGVDLAQALLRLREADAGFLMAQALSAEADRALETAVAGVPTEQLEQGRSEARVRLATAQSLLETSTLDVRTKRDIADRADEEAQAATVSAARAADDAEEAGLNLSPVSVLISRKTQRLYVRKANQPVFEAPVLIRDARKPIGSFVFTALDDRGAAGAMRWNVVSMYKNPADATASAPQPSGKNKGRAAEPPALADSAGAQAALDRLTVTDDAQAYISQVILPGSSLIISDEAPSIETGKDTDFVLFMSGEPQGGIAIRQHAPPKRTLRDEDGNIFGRGGRDRRGSGGGFPFFWFGD